MKHNEYTQLRSELTKKGYRYQSSAISGIASHSFSKPFGKYHNPYDDEKRSCYQIIYEVYDYRPFAPKAPTDYGIEVRFIVSRTIDDRVDMVIAYEGQSISYLERLAESLYEWVDKNIKLDEK